jgi:DnaK suppressor protein
MTKAELEQYSRQLLDLRRRLGGGVRDVWGETMPESEDSAGAGVPATLTDPGDVGVHEYEEQVDHALAGNEERLFLEVDAALDRIAKGTFGRCETCGRPISHDRLRAVPYTRLCIDCARREEASGR